MDFGNLERAVKFAAGSNAAAFLKLLSPDVRHTEPGFLERSNAAARQREPGSPLRLIAADAFDEEGRTREAHALRHHDGPVWVFGPKGKEQVVRTNTEDLMYAVQGYKDAALWSSVHYGDEDDPRNGHPLGDFHTVEDLHPATHAKMFEDVVNFFEDNYEHIPPFQHEQTGHDLWLSRNGHGSGFFDKGEEYYGESADHLQEQARKLGEFRLSSENGLIHGYGG
jgi:hypothetical protein